MDAYTCSKRKKKACMGIGHANFWIGLQLRVGIGEKVKKNWLGGVVFL